MGNDRKGVAVDEGSAASEGSAVPSLAKESEGMEVERGSQPRLGPWVVTSRVRLPRSTRAPVKGWKESGKEESGKDRPSASASPEVPSSSPPRTSPTNGTSTPSSPLDSDGWQKLTKVAHRRSSGASSDEVFGDGASGFGILCPLGDCMELSLIEAGPKDQYMVDQGSGSLKHGSSLPTSPVPSPRGASLALLKSSSSEPAATASLVDKVCASEPCMEGDLGGKGLSLSTSSTSAKVLGESGHAATPNSREKHGGLKPVGLGGQTSNGSKGKKSLLDQGWEARQGGGEFMGSARNAEEVRAKGGDPALSSIDHPVRENETTTSASTIPILISDVRESPSHEEVVGKLKVALFSAGDTLEAGKGMNDVDEEGPGKGPAREC